MNNNSYESKEFKSKYNIKEFKKKMFSDNTTGIKALSAIN